MRKNEKKFDCIAFKRTAQLQIYEEIKNMSGEEQIAKDANKMLQFGRDLPGAFY